MGDWVIKILQVVVLNIIMIAPIALYLHNESKWRKSKTRTVVVGTFLFALNVVSTIFNPFGNVQLIPFLFIVAMIIRSQQRRKGQFLYDEALRWDMQTIHVVTALAFGIGMEFISGMISIAFKQVLDYFNIPAPKQPIIEILFQLHGFRFYAILFLAVVIAPIVEEYVIRRWLYDQILKKYMSIPWAMIVSAVVFGLLHFNLLSFPAIILIGLVNCVLYDRKGYWWPVFLHMGFNGFSTLMMLAAKFLYESGLIKDLDKIIK